MNPQTAEALRRHARPYIGGEILVGNDDIGITIHEFVGIRMQIFHSNPNEQNPVEFWNIETGDSANITIPVMVDNLVSGEFIINLDAIIKPKYLDKAEYVYQQLEPFLYKISKQ